MQIVNYPRDFDFANMSIVSVCCSGQRLPDSAHRLASAGCSLRPSTLGRWRGNGRYVSREEHKQHVGRLTFVFKQTKHFRWTDRMYPAETDLVTLPVCPLSGLRDGVSQN